MTALSELETYRTAWVAAANYDYPPSLTACAAFITNMRAFLGCVAASSTHGSVSTQLQVAQWTTMLTRAERWLIANGGSADDISPPIVYGFQEGRT